MIRSNGRSIIAAVALVACLGACDGSAPEALESQKTPEVNDENCKPENIAKVQPLELRQSFAGQCLRR